ncbi:MAG TPA: flagellar assembly peptidoglycan hydrolase FlgJ [Chromobacteriaceae bacterium]|nr:flagellar assembly peptidoglycan hydrolase FlgJ [Chromobacteriaceae bacterium]
MNIPFSNKYSSSDALANQLAIDPTQLSGLQRKADKDPKAAVREVAGQFEALLMGTLVKAMRETKLDGEEDSSDMDTYRSMLDQQMVQSLSKTGMGLGDVLYRQIAKSAHLDTTNDTKTEYLAPSPSLNTQSLPTRALKAYQQAQNAAASAVVSDPAATAGTAVATTSSTSGKSFAKVMLPHARNAANQLGVAPEFVVAHAALESGWGKRSIKNSDGSESHNLFGIKAGGDWQGATTNVLTTEYVNGTPQKRVEKFRSYGSYAEAFSDYANLLKDSPRYRNALNQGQNMYGFAQGLQTGGYATDPRYARKLVDVATSVLSQSVRS